jgi:hypothetical protein
MLFTGFLFCLITFISADLIEKREPLPVNKKWLPGFARAVFGEEFTYHSPHHDQTHSLLVRSLEKHRHIEWETAPLPKDYTQKTATFVWMFGIDANPDSHNFDLFINGEKYLTFANPLDTSMMEWRISGKEGVELFFKSTMIDRYEDFMGYAFLTVPASRFPKGEPLTIRIAGETAGSRSWYMTFMTSLDEEISLSAEEALIRRNGKPYQTIRAEIIHLDKPAMYSIKTDEVTLQGQLELGYNSIQIPVRKVDEATEIQLSIRIENRPPQTKTISVKPVDLKTCYLLHHSHVDIGYTHVQTDVEKIQWENLEKAIEYGKKTQDYPMGSRFKWNVEVMWAVDSYLKNASPDKQQMLIEAVQKGWIGLDGLYANAITGICRPEELLRLLESGRRIAHRCGIPLESAMITDIPGYSWGLVPALVQSGIKYLCLGTNAHHRIGTILKEWADKPFYWASPSGEEKVLCWIAGKSYSWFHTGLGATELKKYLEEKPVLDYMKELKEANYPYDIVTFHYNIGSDNGPPDPGLADKVKEWNEKFISPRLIIATNREAFRAFEEEYGKELPVLSGDFTGYWEDGAASSARETALNREAAERIVQAEVLWSILKPSEFPQERFDNAWEKVLLFSEHTWGSWNSISAPEDEFTKQQWAIKQSFALDSDRMSENLIKDVLKDYSSQEKNPTSFDVINTASWPRSDIVILPEKLSEVGNSVKDNEGKLLCSQRLSTGELAVLVEDIPPLGAKRFFIEKTAETSEEKVIVSETEMSNELVTLRLNEETGAISSLKHKDIPIDLVDSEKGIGLNDYFYVSGRNPADPQRNGKVKISLKEKGPFVCSLLVESDAPGCRKLTREIWIIEGVDRIDIIDTIDKENIYDPEGVHIAFPFQIPEGVMRMDGAWSYFRPEHDQLPGSNKNYISIQRWIDISNSEFGITWASPDAPLVEVGEIRADPVSVGWVEHLEPSQTFYSYVMNNYWETNYKASQEGPVKLRYSINFHGAFDPAQAKRFGIERCQPLIVSPAQEFLPVMDSFFSLDNSGVIVSSIKPSRDGEALIIRLFNTRKHKEKVSIIWGSFRPEAVFLSNLYEEKVSEIPGSLEIPPLAIRTLRLKR